MINDTKRLQFLVDCCGLVHETSENKYYVQWFPEPEDGSDWVEIKTGLYDTYREAIDAAINSWGTVEV